MFAGGCADRLILYPRTERLDAGGATRVALDYSGGNLELWTRRLPADEEPRVLVLGFCGNAERAEEAVEYRIDRWSGRPVEMWAVNYPGYGRSTGPATLSSIGPTALLAYDALSRRAAGRPVFLDGTSLGSVVALFVAACRPCAGLLLTNPPPLRELILGQFGWWNLWLLAGPVALSLPSDLDSLSNARQFTAPAIFVLADRDVLVPPRYQKMVVNAYTGKKQVIVLRGARHNSGADEEEIRRIQEAVDGMIR